MRHLKRATALLCLLIAILSCFNMAALGVSTINVQKNSSAAKTKGDYMCFYFKASSTKATITFTRKKGTLTVSKNNIKDTYTIYGSYEVKLQQCDNKGNLIGSELFKQDVYNNSREKTQVTFATTKNAYYRVKVWSWNPNTVAKSYLKNNIMPGVNNLALSIWMAGKVNRIQTGVSVWTSLPGCTAGNASGCTLYTSLG